MRRISVSKLENLYQRYNDKDRITLFIGHGEDRFEFEVKHHLDIKEATGVVTEVCNGVVDTETGDYRPELKDYLLRVAILKAYTNLSLPKGDKCWKLVYGTPVFAMVTGHERRPVTFDSRDYDENVAIDVEQYEQLLAAIDQGIAYTLMQNRSSNTGVSCPTV